MKTLLLTISLLLAACSTIPTNPDLPREGDKNEIIISNSKAMISVNTNRIITTGDLKTFYAFFLTKQEGKVDDDITTAVVDRVGINCKDQTVKMFKAYQLNSKGKVLTSKDLNMDFSSIKEGSLGELAYPIVCGKPIILEHDSTI